MAIEQRNRNTGRHLREECCKTKTISNKKPTQTMCTQQW